jgi:hypothetical protein
VKRWEANLNHAATIGLVLTGVLYAVMKYWMAAYDPDAVVGHPWQPFVQKAHLLVAPFSVFGLGLLASRHVLPRVRSGYRDGRRSGLGLASIAIPAVVSGYLVQVFLGESARRWTGWLHTGFGLAFALAWLLHPRTRRVEADEVDPATGD